MAGNLGVAGRSTPRLVWLIHEVPWLHYLANLFGGDREAGTRISKIYYKYHFSCPLQLACSNLQLHTDYTALTDSLLT